MQITKRKKSILYISYHKKIFNIKKDTLFYIGTLLFAFSFCLRIKFAKPFVGMFLFKS